MGDFLPGMIRMIEERFGPAGRPLTTLLLGIFALAIIAWSLGLIYDNVVGPVLDLLGKDVEKELVDLAIAWVSLAAFIGFIGWVIIYVANRIHGKKYEARLLTKRERIRELEAELTVLRNEGGDVVV